MNAAYTCIKCQLRCLSLRLSLCIQLYVFLCLLFSETAFMQLIEAVVFYTWLHPPYLCGSSVSVSNNDFNGIFFYLSVTKICFKKLLPFFNFALFVSIKVLSQKPDTNYSTKTLENLTFWETAKHASSNNSSYIKIIFTLLVKIKILPQELYQLR